MKKRNLLMFSIVLVLGLVFMGCGKIKNYDRAVITIDDGKSEISLGYANFAFKYNQVMYDTTYLDKYGKKMWTEDMTGMGDTFEKEVKDNVIETLEDEYVIVNHAKDFNISISDEEKSKIENVADEFIEANSKPSLEKMGANRDVVIEFLTNLTYVSKVEAAIVADGKAKGQINSQEEETTYINTITSAWKNNYKFEVDDALWAEVGVKDLFKDSSDK